LGAVRQALGHVEPVLVAQAVSEGRPLVLPVNGTTVELAPDEVLVDMQPRPGFAAVEADGYLVGLDTTLTPALVEEGIARDLVRAVNEARKEAGLRVEDQIDLWYDGAAAVTAVIGRFAEVIQREVLAASLQAGPGPADAFQTTADLGDHQAHLALMKTRGVQ
jgi:isoleucyl-tRNA synthetase